MYVFGSGRRMRRRVEWMRERIGFGLYPSCGNRGSVGRVYVFGLRWCGLGRGFEQGLEGWDGVMPM